MEFVNMVVAFLALCVSIGILIENRKSRESNTQLQLLSVRYSKYLLAKQVLSCYKDAVVVLRQGDLEGLEFGWGWLINCVALEKLSPAIKPDCSQEEKREYLRQLQGLLQECGCIKLLWGTPEASLIEEFVETYLFHLDAVRKANLYLSDAKKDSPITDKQANINREKADKMFHVSELRVKMRTLYEQIQEQKALNALYAQMSVVNSDEKHIEKIQQTKPLVRKEAPETAMSVLKETLISILQTVRICFIISLAIFSFCAGVYVVSFKWKLFFVSGVIIAFDATILNLLGRLIQSIYYAQDKQEFIVAAATLGAIATVLSLLFQVGAIFI